MLSVSRTGVDLSDRKPSPREPSPPGRVGDDRRPFPETGPLGYRMQQLLGKDAEEMYSTCDTGIFLNYP